jgi:hypothetical protein
MSSGPAADRRMLATPCSTRSPTKCPYSSLMPLKRSQSISNRPRPWVMSVRRRCCRCRWKPRRFARPVSSSVRVSSSVCVRRWLVARSVSSAVCRSRLRRRRRPMRLCSFSTTRMMARRRKWASRRGSRSTSWSNSSWRNSTSMPGLDTMASALRAWSPISRPSSPKNSRAPRRLATRSSPKSRSTEPCAMTNIVVPRSPRRKSFSPGSTRRWRPICANSVYSSAVSEAAGSSTSMSAWRRSGGPLSRFTLRSPEATGDRGYHRKGFIPGRTTRGARTGRPHIPHAAAAGTVGWNCSSSVEPFSATVEDCAPWMVCVTASK